MASSRRTRDQIVLEAIFNPEDPTGFLEEEVDTSTAENESGGSGDSEEVRKARELEVEAIRAAEAGNCADAVEILSRAIALAPEYASPYNNRAQVYQLQHQVDLALADLDKALELSGGRGKVAGMAYTQRGIVRRMRKDDEGALEDFKKASHLGNTFAHHQVIKMNPYAALCNEMLSEVFEKVKKGEATA